jgi:hypothetical protein
MIEELDQFDRFYPLAQLPADAPARRQLEAELAMLEPSLRAQWDSILQETDQLRAAVAHGALPPALQLSLANIPLSHPPLPPLPWWKNVLKQPVGWMHLTTCALVAVALLAWINWPASPPAPPQPLDDQTAQCIATFALANHAHPALLVASDDPAKVQQVLASQSTGLDPAMPEPTQKMLLLGGGATHLGGANVLFTRWQLGPTTYTLYELDGKPLGLPPSFAETVATPHASGAATNSYRVMIWPAAGGADIWALVLESDSAPNYFMDSCH